MKLLYISILLLCFNSISYAQTYDSYDWDDAVYDSIFPEYSNEGSVIIFDKEIVEFYFDYTGDFRQIYVTHKKILVNNNDAISEYNRIILPSTTDTREVVKHKTRVITKEGKVIDLDHSAVKTKKDEETGNTYKYYAIEGIEKGSQIEYYYIVSKPPYYTGSLNVYQSNKPKQKVEFTLVCPERLDFVFYPLNGAKVPVKDTNVLEENRYTMIDTNVAKVEDEAFANYRVNLKQFMYKLEKDNQSGNSNFVNYGDLSQTIYELAYNSLTKKEKQAIKKIIKDAEISDTDNDEDKIFKLEQYLKKNIQIYSALSNIYIDFAYENKVTSDIGMLRAMGSCLKQLGIDHQIVVTCDRESARFVDDFESQYFLDAFIFYFPKLDKYLDPTSLIYRLGYIPTGYIYNKGLFIKEVSVADYSTGAGKIKDIVPQAYTESKNNMYVNVTFNKDLQSINITYKNELSGYNATQQVLYDYLDPEETEEAQKEAIKYLSSEVDIDSMHFENVGSEFYGRKPLIANAKMTSTGFLDKAADKILFKVGDLIGPQTELYSEHERTLPIENVFNRQYYRIITFEIPEGYKVLNLDDILINESIKEDDGSISAKFHSTYKIEGNKVIITVDEYYNKIYYPIDKYEDFRKVVNAAADFNKVVYVLSKE